MPTSRLLAAGAIVLTTVVAACGVVPSPGAQNTVAPTAAATGSQPTASATPTSTPTVDPVKLTANVADGASKVKVDTLVKVTAAAGQVTSVKLAYGYTDRTGKKQSGTIKGAIAKNGSSWTAGERLDPDATYKLTMTGKNTAGTTSTASAKFTTQSLTLAQQTFASPYPLRGSTVGIGMPAILNFDVPVRNKKEFEKNLHVTSVPAQAGSWRWFSDREVRYRPAKYWKPGTKVSVYANLNGVNAGNGIYGQSSVRTSFTVGRSMIIKVNLHNDVAKVYRNGKVVRTIYVTGGKPGWETRSGIKLIMAKEWNKVMTNEMIGAKEKYKLTAPYAMRITNSGEFLHAAPWSLGNLGRRNASHGCTGMSNADAGWLINQTLIGDPVVETGTSRRMELGNGYGDWNISYKQYKKGSALA